MKTIMSQKRECWCIMGMEKNLKLEKMVHKLRVQQLGKKGKQRGLMLKTLLQVYEMDKYIIMMRTIKSICMIYRKVPLRG